MQLRGRTKALNWCTKANEQVLEKSEKPSPFTIAYIKKSQVFFQLTLKIPGRVNIRPVKPCILMHVYQKVRAKSSSGNPGPHPNASSAGPNSHVHLWSLRSSPSPSESVHTDRGNYKRLIASAKYTARRAENNRASRAFHKRPDYTL